MRDHNRYPFNPEISSTFRIYYGEQAEAKIKPDFILLGDAFPNPSDGRATIPFTLPDMGNTYQVKLDVFDLLGQKVSTVHEGEMKAGFHSALWTANADQTGVYVYRLAVTSHSVQTVQTKKIILKR
jgi:hypothetical protein